MEPPHEWLEQCVEIRCPKGLHMRPASAIAKIARSFNAEIFLCKAGLEASATSVIKLLQLEASAGTLLSLRARGPDALSALHAICAQLQLVDSHPKLSPPSES
ncbi:HPr family phosphocarrier protein [Myxococcota bacterium]|nr:HPr family phosphocarrier protein [Myxococcota bacterium]